MSEGVVVQRGKGREGDEEEERRGVRGVEWRRSRG